MPTKEKVEEIDVTLMSSEDIVKHFEGKDVFITSPNLYLVNPSTQVKFKHGQPVECKVDSWVASQLRTEILVITDKPKVR